MNATRILMAAAMVVSMGACNKYMIKVGSGGNTSGTAAKDEMNSHFIAGLIGEGNVDVNSICPSGNATVQIERSLIDGILGGCTGGLWMPSHIRVYCGEAAAPAAAPAASLDLSPEQTKQMVASDAFVNAVEKTAPEKTDEALKAQAMARSQN